MGYHDLVYWLSLKAVPGVGNNLFRTLVDALETPRKVFEASERRLTSISGIGEATARNILAFDDWQKAEEELDKLTKFNAYLLTYHHELYPRNLLNIYDFPPFLYVKGTLKKDEIPVALVGSRMASPYGRFSTEKISRELALGGITVVSGLARGIDTAAHRGALAARGRTIAVLGCGIDVVYPPENLRLYQEIPRQGAIITEYPPGTPPHRLNFPARNRIISGISYGVVVVEAGEKSGSLITARLALEQGREVFAVPGAIGTAGCRGTHRLIRDGAKLIESARDILEEIAPQLPPEPAGAGTRQEPERTTKISPEPAGLNTIQAKILSLLAQAPANIDEITIRTNLTIVEVQRELLNLELKGALLKLPGNIYKVKD